MAQQWMSAAQQVADIQLRYAQAGTSLAQAALAGAQTCVEHRHYPAKDVFDSVTGNRFYYHAHTSHRSSSEEHGHFHLFHYSQSGQSGKSENFFHVVGLSIDAYGSPLRWFTTNRWVTGERLRQANQIERILLDFRIHARGRLSPIAAWLSAMVRLFSSDIAKVIHARDAILKQRFTSSRRAIVLEDRALDIVSECSISLPLRIQQLVG